MKLLKKINKLLLVAIMSTLCIFLINPQKATVDAATSTYRGKVQEIRAVWVSHFAGDVHAYSDEESYKSEILGILDNMESMGFNTMIFHIRTHNNALYKSKLNPVASFWSAVDFDEFDPLEWMIEECHSRGIEFHAWLNPYRIKAKGFPEGYKEQDIANLYKDYPNNPASDASNILLNDSTGAILNPCKEVVQKYIIDVCLELMANYNIDAIHFDDYFYAKMTEKNEALLEDDQTDYIEYIKNNPNCGYKVDCEADKKDWRRENVDKFIHDLSVAMRKFNKENNRQVQLGISPTGIYMNGNGEVTYDENGTAITNGSNTNGQEHYASYLYCDSKKWVDNEWIDYIIPQTYWGLTHPVAGFADLTDWWDKVVANKKVNLYCGMGIYMTFRQAGAYSWTENAYEASDEVLYCSKKEFVKGTCVFSFKSLVRCINDEATLPHIATERIRKEYWNNKIKTPKTIATGK